MGVRLATYDDIERIEEIFHGARKLMIEDGNPTQWGNTYPNRAQIISDIDQKTCWVLVHDDVYIYCVFTFIIGPDPTYTRIDDGQWVDDTMPYGTIHRIASSPETKGIFKRTLEWCEELMHHNDLCSNIRIDTHADNARMIHLIEQAGFTRCGIIYTRDNSPRIAYQKIMKKKNIAVFASGTGTTLQTLIDKQAQYNYCVALAVTNRECAALERAANNNIPSLQTKDWEEIDKALQDNKIELIVLAGFLAIIPAWICQKWEKRIINVHPSLLPKFGGKGMYGIRVQEAVLAAGETEAGCTVHFVSAAVDGGGIIAQATVGVEPQDTAESLSLRVQQAEKVLLPKIVGELLKDQTV
jgi:phosphoribosylglycinamide formyltransferase-1